MSEPTCERFRLASEIDVTVASSRARELALSAGLSQSDAVGVATAVTEIANNALLHGGGAGEIELATTAARGVGVPPGITVIVRDRGPGIRDIEQAMIDGYSTRGSLGLGLPGARRLMDELAIGARDGGGVGVRMVKWAHPPNGGTPPPLADWDVERGATPEGAPGRMTDALVTPYPNGLLAVAMRAAGATRASVEAVEHARELMLRESAASPVVLAERSAAAVPSGAVLDLALLSLSGLDGRMAWLRAGAAAAQLQPTPAARGEADPGSPPTNRALEPGGFPPRGATHAVRRGDRLTLAAGTARVELRVLRGMEERRPR